MQTTTIARWDEFEDLTKELDGWAFRGHQFAGWPLHCSLSRHLRSFVPDPACWPERETRAIRVFRRKAHNYITDLRILDDDLRCLALMQHHGAPTRLLDFTKSPFVAAFFALEFATDSSVVFALNTPVLWRAAPRAAPELTHEKVDPRIPGNYEKYFVRNDHEMVWTGEPHEMDRRLVAQSGTFLIPGTLHESVEEILSRYESPEPLLRKLIFPAHLRTEFMHTLYRMNITNASLFPDLDGLAKSAAFELEIIWKGLGADNMPSARGEVAGGEG